MKLTLRKANALKQLIVDKLNSTSPALTAQVGKYDDAEKVIESAVGKFNLVFNYKHVLNGLLYVLRKKVASASQEVGISDLLTDMALVDRQVELLKPIATQSSFRPDIEQVKAHQADLLKEQPATVYRAAVSTITVNIIDESAVQQAVAQLSVLRKQKVNISDKLLELNITTEIELSDEQEKILRDFDLI